MQHVVGAGASASGAVCEPHTLLHTCRQASETFTHHLAAQELVCQERPLRGHLRSPRVPEECPEAVRALIDACIEADAPAQRPSAYEIFVHLATRYAVQNIAQPLSFIDNTQADTCTALQARKRLRFWVLAHSFCSSKSMLCQLLLSLFCFILFATQVFWQNAPTSLLHTHCRL